MKTKLLCIICKRRPALYKYRGKFKRRKDHDICRQCYRSLIDSNHSKLAFSF